MPMKFPNAPKMKGLSEEQARALLEVANKAKKVDHTKTFLQEHIKEIAQAVKENKDRVELDGRTFLIAHKEYYDGCVLVYPIVGFVPSGYISYHSLDNVEEP